MTVKQSEELRTRDDTIASEGSIEMVRRTVSRGSLAIVTREYPLMGLASWHTSVFNRNLIA